MFISRKKPSRRANKKGIALVLAAVETDAKLARLVGTTKQNVWLWKKNGAVPLNFVTDVSNATGVARHLIRPDHYGESNNDR